MKKIALKELISFDQLEVGMKVEVFFPWIKGHSVKGTLTKIVNLVHSKDSVHKGDEKYKQFVLDNGKFLFYNVHHISGRYNEICLLK